RRLVQQQDVAARAEELRKMHAVAVADGEIPPFLLPVCAAGVEGRRVRPRVSGPRADLDVLLAAGDLLPHALRRIERVARLRNVGELYRIPDAQRSRVDLLFAGDEPKERGLAGTVRTDHPDDRSEEHTSELQSRGHL